METRNIISAIYFIVVRRSNFQSIKGNGAASDLTIESLGFEFKGTLWGFVEYITWFFPTPPSQFQRAILCPTARAIHTINKMDQISKSIQRQMRQLACYKWVEVIMFEFLSFDFQMGLGKLDGKARTRSLRLFLVVVYHQLPMQVGIITITTDANP